MPEARLISTLPLETGAEARLRNGSAPLAAVLVNGGTSRLHAGTWSATSELLARELAPRFPGICFVEVRYRIKSWKALDGCVEDARAAVTVAVSEGAESCLLVGFSMGGAVSIGVAGDDPVWGVLGLSPWIPGRLSLGGLRGKRLDVLQGGLDRGLPGVPGISPASSLAGFERALAQGVDGSYELVRGGLHGCAVRGPSGRIQRLPRWRAWVEGVAGGLARFQSSAERRLRAS
jgi:pimeloyl-ACP methyl ester carboxylesterase